MIRLLTFLIVTIPLLATDVTIRGDQFFINGKPTYQGRTWNGHRIEGLLFNSRMVQGIYDDQNPETRQRWAYKDTGRWDANRNTNEFIAAMPEWRKHGLLAFTINLQGGSPEGYSKAQPWHNSAILDDGSLRKDAMARLDRILKRADSLGMAVIVGIFYFGQDQRVKDEAAVVKAVDNTINWVIAHHYRNVMIEVNNEANNRYHHANLRPENVHELMGRVRKRGLLASTSYTGNRIPEENVVRASDFLLLHGNGVKEPERIAEMVRLTRQVPGYRPMPILFNEDDHFEFDKPMNNMVASVSEYCSWGYFDPDGYQSPPVNWGLNTDRKRDFFKAVAQITGAKTSASKPSPPGLPSAP
jgi:hypothetical protein